MVLEAKILEIFLVMRPLNVLIRQVCDNKWHAAANSIAKHSELFPEILKAVNKNASDKMSEYLKSESKLLSNKPDEIIGFLNTIFLKEM